MQRDFNPADTTLLFAFFQRFLQMSCYFAFSLMFQGTPVTDSASLKSEASIGCMRGVFFGFAGKNMHENSESGSFQYIHSIITWGN